MKLYWIRHLPIRENGCYIGRSDVPAIMPAQQAASPLPANALWFSSPLERAETTARWLMQDGKPLHLLPELQEQNFGAWEGRSYDAVWKESEHRHNWAQPESVRPPGGESFIDVCARVESWLNWLMEEHIEHPVVIVTHAGIVRAGLAHALKLTPAQGLAIQVDYASVTHVSYYPDSTCVHCVNVPLLPTAQSHLAAA